MSLRREIAKLEQVEEIQEEEELTEVRRQAEQRSIDAKLVSLYRRINIIVEYIDNSKENEVTTITEQQLKQDEQHFREAVKEVVAQKIKDYTKLKERENVSYGKGFRDGVNYTMKRVGETREEAFPAKELKEAIEKALSIKVPLPDLAGNLADILSQTLATGKNATTEEPKEAVAKDKTGLGLGRAVGDV